MAPTNSSPNSATQGESTSPKNIFVEEEATDPYTELAEIEAEFARRDFLNDAVKWVETRLGNTLWSGQVAILRSVATHRRTAVMSCHEVGKSFIAARLAAWWLDTHKPGTAFVVTSAPTAKQVQAVLWREINRAHSEGKLPGRTNQTEWFMLNNGKEELVAFGRKPSDYDATSFQGIHAPFVLVILDEACGIPAMLFEGADTLIANDNSKIVAIGNPDDPQSEFANICKPGSGWNVLSISAFDSPNFTGEVVPKTIADQLIGRRYVEEKRRKWAPNWYWVDAKGEACEVDTGVRVRCPEGQDPEDTNPFWQSKVLGVFPTKNQIGGLIPLLWISLAQQRELEPDDTENELGVDVGAGGDSSTTCHRRGGVARIISEDRNPDTMQTCGKVIAELKATGARLARVDVIGIGKGVVDRGQEQDFPFVGINVSEAAHDSESFVNRRAELYWAVRTRFEEATVDIDPADDDLASELAELRFKRTSKGQIQIESKLEMKQRGVPSPNRAEALMLSMAQDRQPGDYGITI